MSADGLIVATICPACKGGPLVRQGPLEWCPVCAHETAASRRVDDATVQLLAPVNEREPSPEMPFEERVLHWIAQRVVAGQPISADLVAKHFNLTLRQGETFMASDWPAYLAWRSL